MKYNLKREITDVYVSLSTMVLKHPERLHAFRHIALMIGSISQDTRIDRVEAVL